MPASRVTSEMVLRARMDGFTAMADRFPDDANPFKPYGEEWYAWKRGYAAAKFGEDELLRREKANPNQ